MKRELPYLISRWLFLRLLGVVYFIAFASIAVQITGLVGGHGILPARQYLDAAHSYFGWTAYAGLPTVFWFGVSDGALRLVSWVGAGLAILLVIGVAPWVTLFLLWALYLSLSVVGQEFLSFQWDTLLLEAGLLGLLWAPMQWLPSRTEPEASPWPRWLLVFLLFKLMFLSGATKLLSGDPTWASGTALDYHFETQPLPSWTAWYAHHLPTAVHRIMTYGSLAAELVLPWLLFLPARYRRVKLVAVAGLAGLQVGIGSTGSYGFFNLLAIVLCIPVIDDEIIRRFLPLRLAAREEDARPRHRVLRAVAIAFFVPSVLSCAREITITMPRTRATGFVIGDGLLRVLSPLRSFNGYGLFRVMTTERPEIVLEGSSDGQHWKEYGFRYKPGDVDRRPEFVAPYHPRLDWQMWFAALDPAGNHEWLLSLGKGLVAGTPEILGLIGRNPFAWTPPKSIRAKVYDYRFSTSAERKRTGAWWTRTLIAEFPLTQGSN
jgi:hypothetical protein